MPVQVQTKHNTSSKELENQILAMSGERQNKAISLTSRSSIVKGIKMNRKEGTLDVLSGENSSIKLSMDSVEDMFVLNV